MSEEKKHDHHEEKEVPNPVRPGAPKDDQTGS